MYTHKRIIFNRINLLINSIKEIDPMDLWEKCATNGNICGINREPSLSRYRRNVKCLSISLLSIHIDARGTTGLL